MSSYVLALDVGTSHLHGLLADGLGAPLASASSPLAYFTPLDCPPMAREFQPGAVMDSLGRLAREVLGHHGVSGREVGAVGITGQRQGMVFLDGSGREVYCSPNLDLRALFQGAALEEQMGRELYNATGHLPCMLLAPARLAWLRDHRPEDFRRTRTALTVPCWVAHRLTGAYLAQEALEAECGVLDVATGRRDPGFLERLGVPSQMLPPVCGEEGATAPLAREVATQWGLREGIPVVVAGPDTQCGLLGMGLTMEGETGAVLGWSGAVQTLTAEPCLDPGMRTWAGRYIYGGLSVAESNLGDSGNAYRWLKDILLGAEASFEEAEGLVLRSPSSDGVVASLGPGPVSSFKAGLHLGGLFFPTPISFQEPDRGQLLRAGLQNVGYGVRAGLETLERATGLEIPRVHLGGGMARSGTLAQLLATVSGLPVLSATTPHVSARGAAMAAACLVDPGVTVEELAGIASIDCREVEPGTPSQVAQQGESYRQWLSLYQSLEWR